MNPDPVTIDHAPDYLNALQKSAAASARQCAMAADGEAEPGGDAVIDQEEQVADDAPVIDIAINNVVCTFNTRCHLNLKRIAMDGMNVIYKRENGVSL